MHWSTGRSQPGARNGLLRPIELLRPRPCHLVRQPQQEICLFLNQVPKAFCRDSPATPYMWKSPRSLPLLQATPNQTPSELYSIYSSTFHGQFLPKKTKPLGWGPVAWRMWPLCLVTIVHPAIWEEELGGTQENRLSVLCGPMLARYSCALDAPHRIPLSFHFILVYRDSPFWDYSNPQHIKDSIIPPTNHQPSFIFIYQVHPLISPYHWWFKPL